MTWADTAAAVHGVQVGTNSSPVALPAKSQKTYEIVLRESNGTIGDMFIQFKASGKGQGILHLRGDAKLELIQSSMLST